MKNLTSICIAALALVLGLPAVVEAGSVPSCGVILAPAAPPPAPAEGPSLTIVVRDADTEEPLAARVGVWGNDGFPVTPPDPEAVLFQSTYGRTHFYCDQQVTVTVPPGAVTIKAGCGFEYVPAETSLVIGGDTTVVVELSRFVDMNAAGWYAADTHVHLSHPPANYSIGAGQALMVMAAEGLNVINAMEDEGHFTGALDPASMSDRLLYFSKEERNAHFGHLSLVGLKQWIPDQTCYTLGHACGRTLTRHIADLVHSQGPHTILIATHPFPDWHLNDISPWPGGGIWRGMTVDLLGGYVDAMDILNYTHAPPPGGVDDYFHALNLGMRVSPSAGSDAVLCSGASWPAGGYRVYSRLDQPLSFDGWVDALRDGHTFVTNYPLISEFTVGGAVPGEETAYEGVALPVRVAVTCARPFSRVEMIAGGVVAFAIDCAPGTTALDSSFSVDPDGAGWIVARITGQSDGWHVMDANGLFAQTAPIYLTDVEGNAVMPPDGPVVPGLSPVALAAYRFEQFTADVVDFFDNAEFTPAGRAQWDSLSANAIDHYKNAWPNPPGLFNLVSPLEASWSYGIPWVQTLTPTFRWRRAIDPDPGDVVTYEFQIDTDYTFDDPIVVTGIADTVLVAPPEFGLEDQETYYWRVFAVDLLGNRRVATPAWWMFIIDMVALPAGGGPPVAWALRPARPNPFNPVVHIGYTVPAAGGRHRIVVYDAHGRRVRTLYDGSRPPGVYETRWDGVDETGAGAASGVYFVRLSAPGTSVTRKVVLLK